MDEGNEDEVAVTETVVKEASPLPVEKDREAGDAVDNDMDKREDGFVDETGIPHLWPHLNGQHYEFPIDLREYNPQNQYVYYQILQTSTFLLLKYLSRRRNVRRRTGRYWRG